MCLRRGGLDQRDVRIGRKTVGVAGKHGGPIPAEAAFNAQVEEIAKRDKIDKPHAIEKALRECPELYLEYEHGQRQRVASY